MSDPSGDTAKELPDMPKLADVQATDALLDRLAARTPSDDDLSDPIIAELARLADFADASPVPPPGVDHLIQVLDGRPLYMLANGARRIDLDDDSQAGNGSGDGQRAVRMIDLTATGLRSTGAVAGLERDQPAAAEGGEGRQPEGGDGAQGPGVAARGADEPAASVALIRTLRLVRPPVTKPGWQGVVQQIAMPAASVIALLALGGGVSAVVTGDPMAPVNGVSRVAAVLPGIDTPEEKKIRSARHDIRVAASAARYNDAPRANKYLRSAQTHLTDVPQKHKQDLVQQIEQVQANLASAAASPPSPISSTPAVSPTQTVAEPTPTQSPIETTVPPTAPVTPTPPITVTTPPSTAATTAAAAHDSATAGA